MRLLKRCNSFGCRNFVENRADAYCEEHKGESDKKYNKWRQDNNPEVFEFYKSTRWRKTRKAALRRDKFLCQDCLEDDVYEVADVVDHIVELKDDWSKRLELENLRSLCHMHHNKKSSEEARKRRG